jgi:hypothetical protein
MDESYQAGRFDTLWARCGLCSKHNGRPIEHIPPEAGVYFPNILKSHFPIKSNTQYACSALGSGKRRNRAIVGYCDVDRLGKTCAASYYKNAIANELMLFLKF